MSLEKYGILLNIDCDSTITGFLNAVSDKETVSENDLYPFVDVYRDSQVTDVLLNSFVSFPKRRVSSFPISRSNTGRRQKTASLSIIRSGIAATSCYTKNTALTPLTSGSAA